MRDFFQSFKFKLLLAVLALLTAFLLRAVYTGGVRPLASGVGSAVLQPITRFSSSVSETVRGWLAPYIHAAEITRKNEELSAQVQALTEQLVDYETYKNENALYREYLEIKEYNNDFAFEPASVIGRSADDRFGSFTIDAGSYHGIHLRDPVITSDGLVGVVTELSYVNATVSTILDVSINVGATDVRTLDVGTVSGEVALSLSGRCRLRNLSRESGAAVGDIITTSGIGGLFPSGLVVGAIESIEGESDGLTLSAVITPTADILHTTTVFVITDFASKQQN